MVVVVHGLGEHSGRYGWLANSLTAEGIAFYGFDQRGHGRSGGCRGDVRSFGDYLDDLAAFEREVRKREPSMPLFLMGHSLGAIVAVLYAFDHQSKLAGLIAASGAFQLASEPGRVPLAAARLLSSFAPCLTRGNGLKPEELSGDPDVIAAFRADPLIGHKVTVRWVTEFFDNYKQAICRAAELHLPLLVLHGRADRIARVDGSEAFFNAAGSSDKTLHIYPGLHHELYNEEASGRRKVFADLLGWLQTHAGSAH